MSGRDFAAAAVVLLAMVAALAVLLLTRHALGAVPKAVESDSPAAALSTHAAAVWAARSPRP